MTRVQMSFFVGYSVGQKMPREKDNAEHGITVYITLQISPIFGDFALCNFGSSTVGGCGLPFSWLYSGGVDKRVKE
jgi:hypothetical protein